MFNKLSTYRHLLFCMLLLSYAQSAFQTPLFEVLHFFAHATDLGTTERIHIYHSHGGDHHHHYLEMLKVDDDENEKDQPADQQPIKKKVELNDDPAVASSFGDRISIDNFKTSFPFQSICRKIPSPPPQFA